MKKYSIAKNRSIKNILTQPVTKDLFLPRIYRAIYRKTSRFAIRKKRYLLRKRKNRKKRLLYRKIKIKNKVNFKYFTLFKLKSFFNIYKYQNRLLDLNLQKNQLFYFLNKTKQNQQLALNLLFWNRSQVYYKNPKLKKKFVYLLIKNSINQKLKANRSIISKKNYYSATQNSRWLKQQKFKKIFNRRSFNFNRFIKAHRLRKRKYIRDFRPIRVFMEDQRKYRYLLAKVEYRYGLSYYQDVKKREKCGIKLTLIHNWLYHKKLRKNQNQGIFTNYRRFRVGRLKWTWKFSRWKFLKKTKYSSILKKRNILLGRYFKYFQNPIDYKSRLLNFADNDDVEDSLGQNFLKNQKGIRFKTFHNKTLYKKSLLYFYGNTKYKIFKKFYLQSLKEQKQLKLQTFFESFERSLFVVVYRMGFAKNMILSRKYVKLGYVKVNNKVITHDNYRIKNNDLISLTDHGINIIFKSKILKNKNKKNKRWAVIKKNFANSFRQQRNLYKNIPDHLIVNFRIFSGIFFKNPQIYQFKSIFEMQNSTKPKKLSLKDNFKLLQSFQNVFTTYKYKF